MTIIRISYSGQSTRRKPRWLQQLKLTSHPRRRIKQNRSTIIQTTFIHEVAKLLGWPYQYLSIPTWEYSWVELQTQTCQSLMPLSPSESNRSASSTNLGTIWRTTTQSPLPALASCRLATHKRSTHRRMYTRIIIWVKKAKV